MAAAVDWLDAYRAADIEAIVAMYADDAVVECGSAGITVIGRDGLLAYWEQRLKDYPAGELDDLQESGRGATISYVTAEGVVGAALEFDPDGRIARLRSSRSR